ncbi:MAG TPA: hypothetical protein DCW73_01025 [Treponema sp.]|nr:hypothetical protein [Treponema sp.]
MFEGETGGNYYCCYCGDKYSSLRHLTNGHCSRNPDGDYHVPYEGEEKSQYTCKYCGDKYSSLRHLTSGHCSKSPTGKHFPAK